MPFKDKEKEKIDVKKRKKRWQERERNKRVAAGMPADGRGKHGKQVSGEKCHRWNKDRIISSHGYVKTRVGKSHPLSDSNGYAYEHLIVWVSAGNKKPDNGFILHHDNENRLDNRIENILLKKRGDHNKHHNQNKTRDNNGRFE
jgi:hypothetical protein